MTEAFVCDAVRTPIGRYGGGLAGVRADDLAATPIGVLKDRWAEADWGSLDDVFFGCANQAGEDNRNIARMALLLAGLPDRVPGTTVNRLCASGLEAVTAAARAIRAGEASFCLAGGVEHMTRAPLVMPKAETAFARKIEIYDTTIGWRFVNARMKELYGTDAMGETAENVAQDFRSRAPTRMRLLGAASSGPRRVRRPSPRRSCLFAVGARRVIGCSIAMSTRARIPPSKRWPT